LETHGERSSRQLSWPHYFTSPNDFCYFKGLITEKITKTHNDTGQTNKYSKQKDKIVRSCPCFCHKIMFYYVRKAHGLLSLSLSLTDTRIVCTHLNISANVVSTTLTILSVTRFKNLTIWLLTSDVATTALFVKKMNLNSHYRHCCRSLTHRGNINLSLSLSLSLSLCLIT